MSKLTVKDLFDKKGKVKLTELYVTNALEAYAAENAGIDIQIVSFKKDDQDTRVKHVFLNEKGKKIFNEIFDHQKKRISNALLNSSSEEVINFDLVLSKIING